MALHYDRPVDSGLAAIERRVVACRSCPRLVGYLAEAKRKFPDHWCRPVVGWGNPRARIVVVGLAPGMHGANRTGRMFTFDSSGRWLYRALHEAGLASRPVSEGPNDGLRLKVFVTAAARCAPPQNRPRPDELRRCRPFLEAEMDRLGDARVYVVLGRIAHDQTFRALGLRPPPFAHGAEHDVRRGIVLDSYHCSRQNTNTGRLTRAMFQAVFGRAVALAMIPPQHH